MFKIIFVFILLLIVSCNKATERTCFKKAGKMVTKEMELPYFNKLEINKKIECELIQDSLSKIEIIGGENLVNLLEVKVVDNKLLLKNLNKCNFVRDYKYSSLKVKIHLKDLINIEHYGSEEIRNEGILLADFLVLSINESAGKFNLNINSKELHATTSGGFGSYNLKGSSNFTHLFINGNCSCEAQNLISKDSIYVVSNSSAPIKANGDKVYLKAQIKKNGDVFYKGSPSKLSLNNIGSGSFIELH